MTGQISLPPQYVSPRSHSQTHNACRLPFQLYINFHFEFSSSPGSGYISFQFPGKWKFPISIKEFLFGEILQKLSSSWLGHGEMLKASVSLLWIWWGFTPWWCGGPTVTVGGFPHDPDSHFLHKISSRNFRLWRFWDNGMMHVPLTFTNSMLLPCNSKSQPPFYSHFYPFGIPIFHSRFSRQVFFQRNKALKMFSKWYQTPTFKLVQKPSLQQK